MTVSHNAPKTDALARLADINARRNAEIVDFMVGSTRHYVLCVVALSVSACALYATGGL